jgi:hypothetical protein
MWSGLTGGRTKRFLTACSPLSIGPLVIPQRDKEHFLLLWHLDRLRLFHRVRPSMKRAQDGLLPMLCLPRL